MERNIILFCLIFVLAACSSEDNTSQYYKGQDVVLFATLEQQQGTESRTALTTYNTVVWSPSDRISVLSKGNNDCFILDSGEGTINGKFKSLSLSSASKYYALYPYSSEASYNGTDIHFHLPETQNYAANSYGVGANPAVAEFSSTGDVINFKNICGALSLYLYGTGNLQSITVTGMNNEDLWGDYTLSTNEYIGTNSQTLTYSTNGGKTVTLNCGSSGVLLSATPKEFNIVVPPGSLSKGFEAVCNFSGGETMTLSSTTAQTIVRSQKHIMASAVADVPRYVNLENDVVKAFLDYEEDNPYIDGDYSYTWVTNYYNTSTSYTKHRPFPVNIEWERNTNSTNQYLTVSENSDFSNPYYGDFELSNTASSYNIYNLIPGGDTGKKYYYKVTALVDGNIETLSSSYFCTKGRRRMLYIDGMNNVRDIGGIPTASGKHIKFGKIFRGAQANSGSAGTVNVTNTGRSALKRAGVLADLDLRGDSESGNLTASPLSMDGYPVDYKRIPSTSYYGLVTSTTDIQDVQWIINELKNSDSENIEDWGVSPKPVYFHCAGGADRAGTLGYLIEGLLGAKEDQCALDYEMTSFAQLRARSDGCGTSYTTYNSYGLYTGICKFSQEELDGVIYPASVTTPWQRRFYNYFSQGIGSSKISQKDLNWFIEYMTE